MYDCNLIKDILPLVAEGISSTETKKIAMAHMKTCSSCQSLYDQMIQETAPAKREKDSAIPIKQLHHKIKKRQHRTIALSVLLSAIVLIITGYHLFKPIPLSFQEAVTAVEKGDDGVYVHFSDRVGFYEITSKEDIDGYLSYDVVAVYTKMGRLFSKSYPKIGVITDQNSRVYYLDYLKQEDHVIYGPNISGGRLTLHRLAMNYYLVIMAGVFVVSGLLTKFVPFLRKISKLIMFFSASYVGAHFLIFGLGNTTYFILHDMLFVLIMTVMLFVAALLYEQNFRKWNSFSKE